MKRGRKPSGGTSVEVSYAEILAEVQRLQSLIGNIGEGVNEPPKQRKKRTVKPKTEAPVESQPSNMVELLQDLIETNPEKLNQQKSQTSNEHPENLTQQQIQVETLEKNLSEEKGSGETEPESTTPKSRYVVSNLEEVRARQDEQQEDSSENPQDQTPKSELQEAPSEVTPQEQQIAGNDPTTNTVGTVDSNKSEPKAETQTEPTLMQRVGEFIENHEAKTEEKESGQTTEGRASVQEQEHHKTQESSTPKNERTAARLAKHNIDPNEEIGRSKLELDKSGAEWGTWSDTIYDPFDDVDQ